MPGSEDLKYAKMVADHIGSVHHSIQVSEQEFLDYIPEVVKAIESYDTTTVHIVNSHVLSYPSFLEV